MAQTIMDKARAEVRERWRGVLQRMFERRFGELTALAKARLATFPAERLEELCEAFATAQSLRDLGLED